MAQDNPLYTPEEQRAAIQKTAAAVPGLAAIMDGADRAAAKHALWTLDAMTHHAARPGSKTEKEQMARALVAIASERSHTRRTRSEAIRLLSFVGGDSEIPALVTLLGEPDLREETRMALERIPGNKSLHALRSALKTAPDEFRQAVKQSLYNRSLTPRNVGTRHLENEPAP